MGVLKMKIRDHDQNPDYWWCPVTGSDANPGSYEYPFQHRAYARDNIPVGATVKRKGGKVSSVISERIS